MLNPICSSLPSYVGLQRLTEHDKPASVAIPSGKRLHEDPGSLEGADESAAGPSSAKSARIAESVHLAAIKKHMEEVYDLDHQFAVEAIANRYFGKRVDFGQEGYISDAERMQKADQLINDAAEFLRNSRLTWNFDLDLLNFQAFISSQGQMLTIHDKDTYEADVNRDFDILSALSSDADEREIRLIVEGDYFRSSDLEPMINNEAKGGDIIHPKYFSLDWLELNEGGASFNYGSSYAVLKDHVKELCSITPYDSLALHNDRATEVEMLAEDFLDRRPDIASYFDLSTFENMVRLFCQLTEKDFRSGPDPDKDDAQTPRYCRLDAIIEQATDHPLTEAQKVSAQEARDRCGADNFNYIEVQCLADVNIFNDSKYISFSADEIGSLDAKRREDFNKVVKYVRDRTKHDPDFVRYHSAREARIGPEQQRELGLP
ncbi:hypothetical protein [Nitratireductor aestuarii]|nr:hypothetical protein [Nitratireductor aestuarii]